jgi:hypothetical protein
LVVDVEESAVCAEALTSPPQWYAVWTSSHGESLVSERLVARCTLVTPA